MIVTEMKIGYIKRLLDGGYVGTTVILMVDTAMAVGASLLALFVATRLFHTELVWHDVASFTAAATATAAMCLYLTKSHRSIIRHMKLRGVARMFVAMLVKVVALIALLAFMLEPRAESLVTFAMGDLFLSLFLLLGMRVALQITYDWLRSRSQDRHDTERVLVYGVGDKAASMITRLQNSPHYRVVGFLIHSEEKRNFSIGDLPVYVFNDEASLNYVIEKTNVSAVIFAHRADARNEEDRLLKYCRQHEMRTLYAPTIDGLNSAAGQGLREIHIEDLLERPSIELSMKDIITHFRGKTILVTGAAGSIGSELCRQLAGFGVSRLVMLDNAETPMHYLRVEFEEAYPELDIAPVIGDVKNVKRLQWVFDTYRPQVVFHAAAYKHVPLMEENPSEAVLTNVVGSANVANACLEHNVEMMVMISTDKAVNPTNVMGCTKRLAEIYVQSLGLAVQRGAIEGRTRFVTTRFGNVLGSNGSVIPRFKEQIAKGGPVTVTHPEINRFFMTIPEACKLVMEAATISIGNQIFVFDMGKSVKIVHLAERMIRLAGLEPGVDIKIEFTGLRPGEKLYEEVLSDEEHTLPTGHSQIRIAKVREYDHDEAAAHVRDLERLAADGNIPELIRLMKAIVPEFKSNNSPFEQFDQQQSTNNQSTN